jgi:hypothetical protein
MKVTAITSIKTFFINLSFPMSRLIPAEGEAFSRQTGGRTQEISGAGKLKTTEA